jgi:hypothetical protein
LPEAFTVSVLRRESLIHAWSYAIRAGFRIRDMGDQYVPRARSSIEHGLSEEGIMVATFSRKFLSRMRVIWR